MYSFSKLEAIIKQRTPGPWPQHFVRIDDSAGGSAATGPIIRLDDEDEEDNQAAVDQCFVFSMSALADLMLDVVKAAHAYEESSHGSKDAGYLASKLAALSKAQEQLP